MAQQLTLFNYENLRQSPEVPGVYTFYNREQEVIFYGFTLASLQAALLAHHKGDFGVCTQVAWYFSVEETTHPVERNKQLLEQYSAAQKRQPKCNETIHEM